MVILEFFASLGIDVEFGHVAGIARRKRASRDKRGNCACPDVDQKWSTSLKRICNRFKLKFSLRSDDYESLTQNNFVTLSVQREIETEDSTRVRRRPLIDLLMMREMCDAFSSVLRLNNQSSSLSTTRTYQRFSPGLAIHSLDPLPFPSTLEAACR